MKAILKTYRPSALLEKAESQAKFLVESGHYKDEEAIKVTLELARLTPEFEFYTVGGSRIRVVHKSGSWIQVEGGFLCYYDAGQEAAANPQSCSGRTLDYGGKAYYEFESPQILWLLHKDVPLLPTLFTVWVGGTEVIDFPINYANAVSIANRWEELGYDDVRVDKHVD